MSQSAEKTFRQAVRDGLAALDSGIESALRSLIAYRYPPRVFALSFEIFGDGFTTRFPVRVYFMDRSNTEYFLWDNGEAQYPSPIDPGLLEIEHVYPEKVEQEFAENSPEANPWEVASEELIQWFVRHWHNAGGANFPLVATIAEHDSSKESLNKSGRRLSVG